jgi:hypothetical protein
MPAFLELGIFFFMTSPTDLGFNRRFFRSSLSMAFVAGNAIYPFLSVFAIYPGLKDASCVFLMTGQTVTNLFLGLYNIKRNEKKKGDDYKDCSF